MQSFTQSISAPSINSRNHASLSIASASKMGPCSCKTPSVNLSLSQKRDTYLQKGTGPHNSNLNSTCGLAKTNGFLEPRSRTLSSYALHMSGTPAIFLFAAA